MSKLSIAIDGPASSGKSTVAKILAKKFDSIYIDTGAMYRAVTYLALQNNIEVDDEKSILPLIEQNKISFQTTGDGQLVFINEIDVTESIRQNDVTRNVSAVAALGGVREQLVSLQRQMSATESVVMDGRDIGTHVLPNASVKIFLVASVEERAQRRYKENLEKNIPTDLETLKEEIALRDHLDSTREVSPLKQASDAILIDTTGLNIEQVVQKITEIVLEKTNV